MTEADPGSADSAVPPDTTSPEPGAAVPWLAPEEQAAWRAFLEMHDELMLRLERDLHERSGLSSTDYQVLVFLSEHPDGRARPVEMCRAMRWEQSRLSHQVTRMEKRGLVERSTCEEDGRGSLVGITAAGRSTIEDAAPGHVRSLRALLVDPLGHDGLLRLGDLSRRVLDAMDDPPA